MVYSNAKDETQGARGDQKASWDSFNPNSSQGNRCTSRGIGYQSLGVNRANWERCNTTIESGCNPGGIVVQLIEETEQELAEHEVKGIKLRDRLQNLRLLLKQLERDDE